MAEGEMCVLLWPTHSPPENMCFPVNSEDGLNKCPEAKLICSGWEEIYFRPMWTLAQMKKQVETTEEFIYSICESQMVTRHNLHYRIWKGIIWGDFLTHSFLWQNSNYGYIFPG